MKINTTWVAKVLTVTSAVLDNYCGVDPDEWEVLEFENGMIMVESQYTDWFFTNRAEIEPCGMAEVLSVEDTGETREYSSEAILKAIQASIKEYGEESVDYNTHCYFWKNTVIR